MNNKSDFEIRANNIETGIEGAGRRVQKFGYGNDPSHETESRVVGMFVTWLAACEEARHQAINPRASFSANVINVLPPTDSSSWDSYIEPKPTSSLRKRAEALWGIRVAFTHGDGDVSLITNPINRQYAMDASNHLPGVKLNGDRLELKESLMNFATRTVAQLRDVLV